MARAKVCPCGLSCYFSTLFTLQDIAYLYDMGDDFMNTPTCFDDFTKETIISIKDVIHIYENILLLCGSILQYIRGLQRK